jgi:peptidyl-prolyl cis-trans isomerase B (cyclophilin B)
VSSKARERAYQKRRYEEWQGRLAERMVRRRRNRRIAAAVSSVLAVVAISGGVWWNTRDPGDDSAPSAAASPSAGSTPSATASASADSTAKGACPAPTIKPPTTPKSFAKAPAKSLAGSKTWRLTLGTSCGDIAIAVDGAKAPQASSVMLALARSGYFDGTPCHRLTTKGIYVLQCGDPTGTGTGGPGYSYGPVENAPKQDVYPAGTVAMARQSGKGDSMGSQFFLVYKDSTIPSDAAGGYTVLGKITKGLGVVKKVAAAGDRTGTGDGGPKLPISIVSTKVAER